MRAGLQCENDWSAAAYIQPQAYLNGAQTFSMKGDGLMGWSLIFRGPWSFDSAKPEDRIVSDKLARPWSGVDELIAISHCAPVNEPEQVASSVI